MRTELIWREVSTSRADNRLTMSKSQYDQFGGAYGSEIFLKGETSISKDLISR